MLNQYEVADYSKTIEMCEKAVKNNPVILTLALDRC